MSPQTRFLSFLFAQGDVDEEEGRKGKKILQSRTYPGVPGHMTNLEIPAALVLSRLIGIVSSYS
jgi:hypothetical protein